ncbi:hypothetical protein GCM10017044_01300 [Kordiimonas sediminis]|uniref:Response regulatory domain-containing protein n=1 Tax=Kordiimonas sediminis TaxID=1735581 RepID=A0A919E4G5_9PROT|nr:pilus assembly protein CpaE [Kordiimonas sediminis]GHF11296.1 hypothetical protein GCM10017044_01300 [Kordiimonas sediminis]
MSDRKNTPVGSRETFAAYICDELSSQLIAPHANDRGWNPEMIFQGGIAAAVRALGAMSCPEVLIVDISDSPDPREDMQALAEVCEADTVVIVLGTINDVTLYRDLLQAGVLDYIVKPLTSEIVHEVLMAAEDALHLDEDAGDQAQDPNSQKRIVCVDARGGLGSSTLAANLAWIRSSELREPTILLDMDTYFGTSCLQFDIEPGRGLADALENPDRVDTLFLERAVVKPNDRLSVLAAEAPIGSMEQPPADALERLMEALGENYQTVIADIPRNIMGSNPDILTGATDVIIVTDLSLAAARDCIRIRTHILNYSPAARIHLIQGMQGRSPDEVNKVDFENSVEMKIVAEIPFDSKAMLTAAQKGSVLVDAAPSSRLSGAIHDISSLFGANERESSAKPKSWMKKILSR